MLRALLEGQSQAWDDGVRTLGSLRRRGGQSEDRIDGAAAVGRMVEQGADVREQVKQDGGFDDAHARLLRAEGGGEGSLNHSPRPLSNPQPLTPRLLRL